MNLKRIISIVNLALIASIGLTVYFADRFYQEWYGLMLLGKESITSIEIYLWEFGLWVSAFSSIFLLTILFALWIRKLQHRSGDHVRVRKNSSLPSEYHHHLRHHDSIA